MVGAEASVRAAGGVILRDGCVLVIHRGRYDDWSLPKGKLEPGESWEEGALREVEEETGLQATILAPLGATRYTDRGGAEKEVRYFAMRASGEPEPCNEVDEVRWVPLAEAASLLSYARDARLLELLERRG